jgi:outer membrane protein assembly factor BamE (lipoprotein component of BamABCDE complex)
MAAISVLALALYGCASTTLKHGHQFQETDLQQVQPGMNEDSVRMALGTPDTTSALPGGNAYYYISSTTKQSALSKEEEVDRKVLAVYFNQVGSVEKVAHYGMKDGRVFDFVKNETPAHMRDKNFISRFFRGVGPKQKLLDD